MWGGGGVKDKISSSTLPRCCGGTDSGLGHKTSGGSHLRSAAASSLVDISHFGSADALFLTPFGRWQFLRTAAMEARTAAVEGKFLVVCIGTPG